MDKNLDYFLPSVCTQDSKKRLQIHTELANYLRDSETSIYCDDLDQFVEGLVSWVTSSNYKVSRAVLFYKLAAAIHSKAHDVVEHNNGSRDIYFNAFLGRGKYIVASHLYYINLVVNLTLL